MVKMRDVEHLEPFAVDYERVAELHGQASRIVQKFGADLGADPGPHRIAEVYNHQSAMA